jgi:Holliday junction resolvase RusA-like endonuclease
VKEITFVLPFPPSVNNLFPSSWKPGGKQMRFPSKQYRKWKDVAFWEIKKQRWEQIKGPVSVSILLEEPDKRARDADNYQKAILDALVKMGVIEDDRNVRAISAAWGGKGKKAHVTVRPYVV